MPNKKITAADITLEQHVAQAGREWLQLNGWKVHRINADRWERGNNRAHEVEEPGVPDYLCVAPIVGEFWRGMYWAFRWEAKRTKGGVIRKSQKDWARDNQGELVTYAKSIEELKAFVAVEFPHMMRVK